MEARAEARFVKVSPQKARLVVDLIRGKGAQQALDLLRFTRKGIAGDVAKVLHSAIANAAERGEHVDVDQLYVTKAYVNEGPRLKRIRPAPMGRAYRYQRRFSHIAVHVSDDRAAQQFVQRVEAPEGSEAAAPAPAAAAARRPAKKAAPARKPAGKGAATRGKAGGKAGAKAGSRAAKSTAKGKTAAPKTGKGASKSGAKDKGGKGKSK